MNMIDLARGADYYTTRAWCSNCGWTGRVQVAKGELAPGKGTGINGNQALCPTCGCRTVSARG